VLPNRARASWRSHIAWIALTLVISLAIADAALAPTPAPRQPDFIDTLFASRAVVAAIRISIVFATLFVALSVIALITQRRWLTRVGPVEVSGEVSGWRAEIQRLEQKLATADQIIENLENQAAYSQQLVDRDHA
jgi:hypothetical protein